MSSPNGIQRIPAKAFNAVFTPMGRKNLRSRLKMYRAGRNASYQNDGTLIYNLNGGRRFVLHRDNQLSMLIFLEGAYEPLETLVVSQAVRAGDVALDIGANVGYFTALLDGLVRPGGQVHSFEPGKNTFVKLEETKKLLQLDQTVLHPKAISDSLGYIDFWLSTSGSDAQQSTVKTASLGKQFCQHRVAATTLDAFAAELQSKGTANIAFVKCDIEGAELSMIKGAQNLIASKDSPIWLIEHNRLALREHGNSSVDLLSPFVNYNVYFVPLCWPPSIMESRQPQKWNGAPEQLPDECNLLVFPRQGFYAERAAVLQKSGLLP